MSLSEPARVGYVLKRFPRLSETFILNEILELERQGVTVEVFSLLEPEDGIRHQALQQVHARVTYLPQKSPLKKLTVCEGRYADETFEQRSLGALMAAEPGLEELPLWLKAGTVASLALARGIRHLHAHFATDATTVAMLAGRLAQISYSFTAHAKDIFHTAVDPSLLREKIRAARFVITVSDYNQRHLMGLCGEEPRKILRLYNGIDLLRFRPDPSVERQPELILAVGRLVEKKGFVHLIHACRRLQDGGRPFRCLLVGEGSERGPLTQEIERLRLQEHVLLAGAQPQERLLQLLRQAAVLVLPCIIGENGDRDALPTVLLEALAVGLPAISTSLVGIPEIIDHGVNGLLVPPGDVGTLADALDTVLGDREVRDRLGREGPAKAQAAFDIRRNATVLNQLFSQLAAGHA